jgi:hypothetical protein
MRVLVFSPGGGASLFISAGWINALVDAGFTAQRWDGKPETWVAFKPDLVIGCSSHRQLIPAPADRKCKVAIHGNPFGHIKIEPNINENNDAINWTITQHPDAVFGYGLESDRKFWSYWTNYNIPWVPMATAGDATLFNVKHGSHDKYDVAFVGGRWDYKAKTMDNYLLRVFRDPMITSMVYGWGGWPADIYKGQIPDQEVPKVLADCKVAPCVSEPHTIQWGIDLPERVFKAALSGAVVVHDPAAGLRRFSEHFIVCRNPDEYYNRIRELVLMSPQERSEIANKQRADVLQSHTYHHRMAALLGTLGFAAEAAKLLEVVEKYRS